MANKIGNAVFTALPICMMFSRLTENAEAFVVS